MVPEPAPAEGHGADAGLLRRRRALLRGDDDRDHTCLDRVDRRALACALAVLIGNEAWNYVFFGRRSPALGLAGTVVFLVPLGALRRAVAADPVSARLVECYGAWVVYDLYWAHGLWRLNPN